MSTKSKKTACQTAPRRLAPREPVVIVQTDPHVSPTRLVREPELLARLGISHVTVWRWIREGRFPVSIRLGPHIKAWREADVEQWIAERATDATACKGRGAA